MVKWNVIEISLDIEQYFFCVWSILKVFHLIGILIGMEISILSTAGPIIMALPGDSIAE